MLTIDEIRIERHSQTAAVLTDQARPVFSFSLSSDRKGCALRCAILEVNGWKKEISEQLNILYEGPALEPFQTYSVKITALDNAGEQAAAQRLFQTGRLGLPWAGKWISDSSYQFKSPQSPVPMFEQGRPNTGRMLGYRLVDGVLQIIPEEAAVVKMIFADYLPGMGKNAIVKKLIRLKIPPLHSTEWRESTVYRILRNEKYTGNIHRWAGLRKDGAWNSWTSALRRRNCKAPL